MLYRLGTDIRGALSMLPRGRTVEAPSVNTIDSDKKEQIPTTSQPQKKGLDAWL